MATSIARQPGASSDAVLDSALELAGRGIGGVPLFSILEDGLRCDCPDTYKKVEPGKKHARCTPGKHPRTIKGVDDASTDPERIKRWSYSFPDMGWGIRLNGLVDVSSDNEHWQAEFQRQGLPRTLSWTSGGGAGHEHHLYRLPEGGPATRLCVSGEYDIMSLGLAVVPPTLHASGNHYAWIVGPGEIDELPIAPVWVVNMLRQQRQRRERHNGTARVTDVDTPPVRLRGDALERWHGRQQRTGDTSGSLWDIARDLARANASAPAIDAALRERDLSLGWEKYSQRDDADIRYADLVNRAFEQLDGAPAAADDLPPTSLPTDPLLVGSEVGSARNGQLPTSQTSNDALEVRLRGLDAVDLRERDTTLELVSLPLLGISDFIIEGWSNLLAAYPRTGKTDLLCASVPTWLKEHKVLWLSEEPEVMWQYRLRTWPITWPRGCRIVAALGLDPAALLRHARTCTEDVVIVDAIRNLLNFEDENNNSEVARKINPWVATMRLASKTLLLVHHNRKGSGDHGEAIAGGHALLGAVDSAVELLRDEHGVENRRRVRSWARVIQPPEFLYEKGADGLFKPLGNPSLLAQDEVERRALETLDADNWQTTKDVHAALGEPKPALESLRLRLNNLAGRTPPLVLREPDITVKDIHGKTARWKLPATSQTSLPTKGSSVGSQVDEPAGTLDEALKQAENGYVPTDVRDVADTTVRPVCAGCGLPDSPTRGTVRDVFGTPLHGNCRVEFRP